MVFCQLLKKIPRKINLKQFEKQLIEEAFGLEEKAEVNAQEAKA